MRVIATAGHVDHGKSTLVEALTGTHPDRLKEEKEREMTIDLGFGFFILPDGTAAGVVDVPGHRDFIENMLAGVGGVDAALLVIAADEGPMPQTREHLAILDLLEVRTGVVALTKTDLVKDAEWMPLVRADIERLLLPTTLGGAEIVPVSARLKTGLSELQGALMRCLANSPSRRDLGRGRLPIDRVFSLPGFGTVVTGTLQDGSFRIGEEVRILPGEKRARIRGMQSHNHAIETAVPGQRAALNLSGVEVADIRRGQVVARPETYRPTNQLDLTVRMLPEASKPLRHNDEVKLFLDTTETMARIRVLGADAIAPGAEGWVQAVLAGQIIAERGDRVILRRPSPGATIGGGVLMDPHPVHLHRRFDPEVLISLKAIRTGNPSELILQELDGRGVAPLKEVLETAGLEPECARPVLSEMEGRGELVFLSGDISSAGALIASRKSWENILTRIAEELARHHDAHPLRLGMPREELRARLGLDTETFGAVVLNAAAAGILQETARGIRKPGSAPHLTNAQEQAVQSLLAQFARDPFNPPSVRQCVDAVGQEVFAMLVERGTLRQVSEEAVFLGETYREIVARITEVLQEKGALTVAQTRDLFGSSRKSILPLLEYLDAQGITKREGDVRRLA